MTWTDLLILGFIVSFSGVGLGFYKAMTNGSEKYPLILIIVGVCIIVPVTVMVSQERDTAIQNEKNMINSWNCDTLGNNVLMQIKSDNSTFLDYQKDLYHFKCEVKP